MTSFFIFRLVLDWIWERVKVDRIIDKNINILDTIPKCWMAWVVAAIWPLVFILGLCIQACCTGIDQSEHSIT